MKNTKGFTIVELLIVVVVIAILAALVLTTYSGVQAKARSSKAKSDFALLEKAIVLARENTDKSLYEITGSTYTASPCNGLEPKTLPKSHACWTQYQAAIDAIAAASKTSLTGLRDGTPYGHPYYIDENERVNPSDLCSKDYIIDRGENYSSDGVDEVAKYLIPHLPGC